MCKKFNVLWTSVWNRLKGRTSVHSRRVGSKSILGPEIEDKLVEWDIDCAARGFPVKRKLSVIHDSKNNSTM